MTVQGGGETGRHEDVGAARGGGRGQRPRSAARGLSAAVLLLAVAVGAGAFCRWTFTSWLPGDLARYRAYSAAEACPGPEARSAAEDCLRKAALTVEGISVGTKQNRLTARGSAPFGRVEVSFGDPGPVLHHLDEGDRITGTFWRGTLVAVTKDGVRQNSGDAPRDEPQPAAALGTAGGLTSALALLFGAARLARPRDPGPFAWNPYGRRLLVTVCVTGAAVGLVGVWTGVAWQAVPLTMTAVVLACAVGLFPGPAAARRRRAPGPRPAATDG